jgi:hypothetical protein
MLLVKSFPFPGATWNDWTTSRAGGVGELLWMLRSCRSERLQIRVLADECGPELSVVIRDAVGADRLLQRPRLIELGVIGHWLRADERKPLTRRTIGIGPAELQAGLLQSRNQFVLDQILVRADHFRFDLRHLNLQPDCRRLLCGGAAPTCAALALSGTERRPRDDDRKRYGND